MLPCCLTISTIFKTYNILHNAQHQPVFTPQEEWCNEIMRGLKLVSNPTPAIQLPQSLKTFKEIEQTLGIPTNKDHCFILQWCRLWAGRNREHTLLFDYQEKQHVLRLSVKTESCMQWLYATNKTETGKVYLKERFECPHLDRAWTER